MDICVFVFLLEFFESKNLKVHVKSDSVLGIWAVFQGIWI